MHRPQIKLRRRAPVFQPIIEVSHVILQLNGAFEVEWRNRKFSGRAQHAVWPGLAIHCPGGCPDLTMVGEITSLPGTRGNRGKALVHADEGAAGEVIAGMIPEELPSTRRMPQP